MINLEPEGEFTIVGDDELNGRSYWIDRFGNVYLVKDYGHSNWAYHHMNCDTDQLEHAGWVHVSGYSFYCIAARLTNSQQNKMLALCEAWERKYTDCLNDVNRSYLNV